MSLSYVVLGILVGRPAHGYELKRLLSPGLPRDRLVNDGILYPLLGRMEKDGLIRKEVRAAEGKPSRHVLHPTAKGRAAFQRWLEEEGGEQDEITYDFLLGHPFLLKCMFFKHLPRAKVLEKLKAQEAEARRKLDLFARIREGMVERGVDPFRIAILDLGRAQQREKIAWLGEIHRRVAMGDLGGSSRRPGDRRKKR